MFFDPDIPDQVFADEVDLVVEVADMMTVFAAERAVRIDVLRREALAAATRNGRVLTDVVERGVRLELAAALRITESVAGNLMAFAQALVHDYPEVLESMQHARMTERHAEILVADVGEAEPEFREQIVEAGVALAETQPVGTFRRKLRALIDTVRSSSLADRYERAVVTRRIAVEAGGDGMGWMHVHAPLVAIHAAHARATGIAKAIKTSEGETRTLDQIRADVVLDLLVDGTTPAMPERARGIRASVVVTVPVLALLHDTDHGRAAAGIDPATVEGIGPIPLPVAAQLAAGDDGWMRVLTHPETGMVLSVGRDRYKPPPALAKLVKWRADRCMGPGCHMPASRCDVDHSVDWALGGRTELTNLGPLRLSRESLVV